MGSAYAYAFHLTMQAAVLKEKSNIDLRVFGVTGSKTMLLSDT